jgi:hypothetical protein
MRPSPAVEEDSSSDEAEEILEQELDYSFFCGFCKQLLGLITYNKVCNE